MENKRLYAFWKYDQFPFCLGGEVTDIRADGSVETVGYGTGYYFKPFLILPLEEGKKIAAELGKLREEHRIAIEAVDFTYTQKVKKLVQIPN